MRNIVEIEEYNILTLRDPCGAIIDVDPIEIRESNFEVGTKCNFETEDEDDAHEEIKVKIKMGTKIKIFSTKY